jgi:hypothetical protein
VETGKKELSTGEILEQTRQLREWLKEKYGWGAIAVIEPHNITIFKSRIIVCEAIQEACPHIDNC